MCIGMSKVFAHQSMLAPSKIPKSLMHDIDAKIGATVSTHCAAERRPTQAGGTHARARKFSPRT